LLVREDFEKENPDAVQRVVDVFVRAAQWSSDEQNREALFGIWARSGTPLASWRAEFEGDTLAVRNSPLLDEFLASRYQAVADDALKLKLIRRPVSVDGWFEPRYLNAALQKAGLTGRWTAFNAQGLPLSGERQAAAAPAR
jgi:sulfonate transport system substrate-binding protein